METFGKRGIDVERAAFEKYVQDYNGATSVVRQAYEKFKAGEITKEEYETIKADAEAKYQEIKAKAEADYTANKAFAHYKY